MAVTTRTSALTRRRFLTTAASSAAIAAIGDRQALSQPRRRPAAHHPRRPVGRRLDRFRRWCGRAPTGPSRMLVEVATTDSFKDDSQRRLRRRAAGDRFHRQGADRRSAGRAGHLLSHPVSGSFASPTTSERAADRALPHRAERPARRLVRLVGRHRGPGLGHRRGARRHAHLCHHAEIRPDFFIHSGDSIYADCPIQPELKLPNGESLDEHRHRREIPGRPDARRVPRQLQIQSARPQSAGVQCRGADASRNGTTTRSPTTGVRARRPAGSGYADKSILALAARGNRAFREFMPMRETQAEAGRIYRKISYGPLLDIFLLDMRSYRDGRTARTESAAAILGPAQMSLAQARAHELAGDLEGDRRRPAARRGQRRRGRARRRRRRSAARSRSPTCWPSSSTPASATRSGSPPTCTTRRRTITIRTAAVFQDFEPFWEFISGPLHAGTWGPRQLDNTFGPRAVYQNGCSNEPGREPGAVLRPAVLRPRGDRRRHRGDDGDAQGRRRPRPVVDPDRAAAWRNGRVVRRACAVSVVVATLASIVAAPGCPDRVHESAAALDRASMSPGCHKGRLGLITPDH